METDLKISTYHLGEHPQVDLPSPHFLTLLTEDGLRKIVNDHYDLLIKSQIKGLFPADKEGLEKAKKNASDFFIQICGGPMYFNNNRGRPMMAQRHARFAITPEARIVWLECYKEVLLKLELPTDVVQSFWNYLDKFSMWMINSLSSSD